MEPIGRLIPQSVRDRLGNVEPLPPSLMRETGEQKAEREALARQHRTDRFYRRLPKRYAEASPRDLTAEQNPDGRVSGWLAAESPTLLLHSAKPGLGKTHAAYAVGKAAVEVERYWVEAWYVPDLLVALRPSAESPEGSLLDAMTCDLLILDDLGKERSTEWTDEQLHIILNARTTEQRRMVLTTNLDGTAMGDRYGWPLVDRLIDGATIVKVTGESRRKAMPW